MPAKNPNTSAMDHWLSSSEVTGELAAVRANGVFRSFQVGVLGTGPLIMHQFSDKAAAMMAKNQSGAVKRTKKPPRDPEAEYRSAFYMISGKPEEKGSRYGLPTASFKHASVSTARHMDGTNMTALRGLFFIVPDVGRLTEIWFDEVRMTTDAVRIGSGPTRTADLRYRPYLYGWRGKLTVSFWEGAISAQQVIQHLELGGTSAGVGDWRREKSNSGWAGTYCLIAPEQVDQINQGKLGAIDLAKSIVGEDMVSEAEEI